MRLDIVCRHKFSDSFTMNVDLSCEVRAMVLFGHSGSGKTSLLSAIAGIFTPDTGRVVIDNQVVFDTDQKINLPPEQRSVGLTPQHMLLFEHHTVRDNLEFGMPHRRKWKQRSAIVCKQEIKFDTVVEVLELSPLLTRYPANLSGGEKQRVAVGRALLSQPRLLILDEPLSALDRGLKERLLVYLKKVIDHWHIPTLITTHSRTVVHELADSVAVVNNGQIINIGSPAQILPKPNGTPE